VPDIRLRSAPWDIMSDDAASESDDQDTTSEPAQQTDDEDIESIQDSIWVNLLSRTRPRPTHYVPAQIQPVPDTSPLSQHEDHWVADLIRQGASLPTPLHAPRCFQRTPSSDLMDQVVRHLKQQRILVPQPVTAAYRCFLVPKADGSARFVIDLSFNYTISSS
jgi:hypothetical protein